jgi:GNAT superfamily N-acetyltransferase
VSNGPTTTTTEELTADDARRSAALNLILGGGPRDAAGVVAQRLAEFDEDCRRRELTPDLLFAAYANGRLSGACVALASPGSAALMLIPPAAQSSEQVRTATEASLTAARLASASRSLTLLQLLQPVEDTALTSMIRTAGFTPLTTLVYLQRALTPVPRRNASRELRWVRFSSAAAPAFCETLGRTYDGSLDCPELAGLRRPDEILASHRSAGDFNPNWWWLALHDDEPVGVLLLAGLPNRGIVEVVYLGVVPAARGTSVADVLLNRALGIAIQACAQTLALAVDERNAPARRLYARWGFVEIGRRTAWIATNRRVGGCALDDK